MSEELKCAGCGHDNDRTRVFCHNCGIRLERPEGSKATISENTPVMGRSTGSGKKGFSFGGLGEGALSRLFRSLVSTAILAAILAAALQAARAPAGIPAPETPVPAKATELYQSLQEFSNTVYPRAIDLTQAQVNNYLAARIIPSSEGDGYVRAEFVRAFVIFEEGSMRYTVEQKLFGWPVYMSLTAAPEPGVDAGSGAKSVSLRLVGGGVGRLPLPDFMADLLYKHLEGVIEPSREALDFLAKADSLNFHPGVARLGWNGSRTPES